ATPARSSPNCARPPESTPLLAAGPRACTISGTPSASRPCSIGTVPASTCTPTCRCCPPTWGTSTPSLPTGICKPHPNCSPWPLTGWSTTWETFHECTGGPHPARILHRPADPPTPGQQPHHPRLPQHLPAAAVLRLAADRPSARPAHCRRPRRPTDRRVPATPGDHTG